MAEALGWVANRLGCRRRLSGHLCPLALLAVATPSRYLGGQTRPNKTASYKATGRPNAGMGQTVNGVEDWGLKAAGTSGWKTPEDVSTRMEVP
jgi:hypothetical protein